MLPDYHNSSFSERLPTTYPPKEGVKSPQFPPFLPIFPQNGDNLALIGGIRNKAVLAENSGLIKEEQSGLFH